MTVVNRRSPTPFRQRSGDTVVVSTWTVPPAATTVWVTGAIAVSLAPGLIPRSAIVQSLLTGILVACALGCGSLARRAFSRILGRLDQNNRCRRVVFGLSATLIIVSVVAADRWQTQLRDAMTGSPTDVLYWPTVGLLSSLIAASLVVVVTRSPSWITGRRLPPALALSCLVATVVSAVMLPPGNAGNPSFPQPYSPSRSGSSASLVDWNTLDRHGRQFASGGADSSTVRTYVGLGSAPTPQTRAKLAADELDRAGGFSKAAVIVALPTGSGWVDDNAMDGLDARFGTTAAVVVSQYADVPSWQAFVFERDTAVDSARLLLGAIIAKLDALAPDNRPWLFVYGQSLGAVAAGAALNSTPTLDAAVCGKLWAGPPAGAIDTRGATVLAHSSDPVVWWSTSLLFSPPDLGSTKVDAPVPRWLPVVTFLQTTVDLVLATGAPADHGHRYGTDQGLDIAKTSC